MAEQDLHYNPGLPRRDFLRVLALLPFALAGCGSSSDIEAWTSNKKGVFKFKKIDGQLTITYITPLGDNAPSNVFDVVTAYCDAQQISQGTEAGEFMNQVNTGGPDTTGNKQNVENAKIQLAGDIINLNSEIFNENGFLKNTDDGRQQAIAIPIPETKIKYSKAAAADLAKTLNLDPVSYIFAPDAPKNIWIPAALGLLTFLFFTSRIMRIRRPGTGEYISDTPPSPSNFHGNPRSAPATAIHEPPLIPENGRELYITVGYTKKGEPILERHFYPEDIIEERHTSTEVLPVTKYSQAKEENEKRIAEHDATAARRQQQEKDREETLRNAAANAVPQEQQAIIKQAVAGVDKSDRKLMEIIKQAAASKKATPPPGQPKLPRPQ